MNRELVDVHGLARALARAPRHGFSGKVVRVLGLAVEATLPSITVGAACEIETTDGVVAAECVGFDQERAILVPLHDVVGVKSGARVTVTGPVASIRVGDHLLGHVVDSQMRPLDGATLAPTGVVDERPLTAAAPSPMTRRRIARSFVTGVRAMDGLLACGEGQRVAIMAGAGVGKSVLLGMLARHCEADVIVVGLVGERGREVREFIERDLGAGISRSVVVVATGDTPPLERVRAALAATSVAEHFRAQGKRVLLLLDSLTRVAMALREIGLAAGEPPTSKGYPPSVFTAIPRLVERAGNDAGAGSITAMYTVLAEGDDLADPVVDCARAALDGHVVLSRKLAGAGHFPAIDILQSVSRVMLDIVTPEHNELARQARDVCGALAESSDLVDIGAYVAGSNPRVDRALAARPALHAFLRQAPGEKSALPRTLAALGDALRTRPEPKKEAPRA